MIKMNFSTTYLPSGAILTHLRRPYHPQPSFQLSTQLLSLENQVQRSHVVVAALWDENQKGQAVKGKGVVAWRRQIIKWTGILVVAAMTFVVLMPTIVMTPRGLGVMLYLFNIFALPSTAQVQIKKFVKSSWFEPIQVEGIQLLRTYDNRIVGQINEVRGSESLLSTVFGRTSEIYISQPTMDLTLSDAGIPKIVHALQGKTIMSKQVVKSQGRLAKLENQKEKLSKLNGELKWANFKIIITGGSIRLPYELNQVLGSNMYIAGAFGYDQVEAQGKNFDIELDWIKWIERKPRGAKQPTMIQANSERFCFDFKGWSDGGRRIASVTPPTICVDFTPPLMKYFLAQVNPLLDNIVNLKDGGQILITLHPIEGNVWMSQNDRFRAQLAPLQVTLKGGPLMEKLQTLIDKSWRSWSGKTLDLQSTSTSFTIEQDGRIITRRTDMLVRLGGEGIHLALWGEYNLQTSNLEMVVGLPYDTLGMIGLKDLPKQYVLPVKLSGTLNQPELDLRTASQEIAELTLRGVAHQLQQSKEGFLGNQLIRFADYTLSHLQQFKTAEQELVVDIPPLEWDLPWNQVVDMHTESK